MNSLNSGPYEEVKSQLKGLRCKQSAVFTEDIGWWD